MKLFLDTAEICAITTGLLSAELVAEDVEGRSVRDAPSPAWRHIVVKTGASRRGSSRLLDRASGNCRSRSIRVSAV
jgi:hypothetical protein